MLSPEEAFVVASIKSPYELENGVMAYNLKSVPKMKF